MLYPDGGLTPHTPSSLTPNIVVITSNFEVEIPFHFISGILPPAN
jgi:hypothetical protein